MKNRFLVLFFLLPFFVYSDDFSIDHVYRYVSGSSTSESSNVSYSNDFNSVQLYYSSLLHAVPYSPSQDNLNYSAALSPGTSSSQNRPFYRFADKKYYPITTADILLFFDLTAARLVYSGFPYSPYNNDNISSVEVCFTNSATGIVFYNLRSLNIVSAALVSTNTLFRSSVLSSLSSLDTSLKFSIQNSLAALDVLNLSRSDWTLLNSLSLDSSYLDGKPFYVRNNPFFDLQSSTLGDFLSLFDDDSSSSVVGRSLLTQASIPIIRDALTAASLDPSSGGVSDFLASPASSLSVIAGHYSIPTTNAVMQGAKKISDDVRESLSNNTQQIKKQLADWHNFASNGVREVNGNLSTIAGNTSSSSLKSAIESANIHIGDSVNVVLDGPVTIDSEQFSTVSVPLNSLKSSVDDWYSQWADFYFSSSPEKGWVKFFDVVSDFKDVNHSDLVSIQSCVSNLLASFSSYTNGLPFAISNAIAGLSISSTNSYLLLSDYADYIHSGGLDALLDVMDDDSYAELKAEVDSLYHADTAEGYGRWWRYFTGLSTVQANSIFKLSNIFLLHEKLLKDLKRDNSDLDVQDVSDPSVFRKLLYTIPSEDDTFNKLSQLTNSIDQSGMARVQELIPDLTNSFSVAAVLFDKDFHLPSQISWELIPSDPSINSKARIVTIRPSEHYRLFQMLHYGLAFSYCIVNIILLPKFLLLLVRLFDRVWNKSEKLIYNSTQS